MESYFACLGSLLRGLWPLVNLEHVPENRRQEDGGYGWGPFDMMFGDVSNLYFLTRGLGVRVFADCY